jgi:GNAT superfamily N-acetyltransferase
VVAIDPSGKRLIGVAGDACLPGDLGSAEISAMVVEDWQHRGVGTALFSVLTRRAAGRGVERYGAIVSAENGTDCGTGRLGRMSPSLPESPVIVRNPW